MQICSLLCLLMTALLLAVYSILTIQRITALRERMGDGADLLALRVQDKLSGMQGTSMYLGSLNSVDSLLVQENPSMTTFSEYAKVLSSVSGSDLSIELMFHKSRKILVSDYGLSSYDTFFEQAFLQNLLSEKKQPDHWEIRRYQQNIYTGSQMVLSYIRSLPLSSTQNNGYIIVSQSLSSLAKTAAAHAEAGLGEYAVWLDEMLLASSADPAQAEAAQICQSGVETAVRAAYWMPLRTMLGRSAPNLWAGLGIWLLCMLLCAATARILCRQRMAKLDLLVQEMGGEWTLEEDYDDQVDQLYRIFESLTTELAHARQTTREGLPLLRERLIGELLRTHVPLEQRREGLERCGILLQRPYFAVVQVEPQEGAFDGQMYLLVRRNVQTQLAVLGEVYSTYGDGSSILFLINAGEYASLSEKLEALCETMHDALQSFLSVDTVFSIGLCTEESPHPHDAYTAARDHLSALRMMDESPQEAVVLSRSSQTNHLHEEDVRRVCDAVVSQELGTLAEACREAISHYLPEEIGLQETLKRAMVFLMRVYAALAETDFLLSPEQLSTAVKQLQQLKTAQDVRAALHEWCCALVDHGEDGSEENNRYVEAALIFIHENYMHSLSVPEIGEKVNVNPIYLNRLFKSATGSTLSNYLSQYRCEHARRMLQETQETVNEISDACGFSEVRSFIRFFKKYYDETPTEYRRRVKG